MLRAELSLWPSNFSVEDLEFEFIKIILCFDVVRYAF